MNTLLQHCPIAGLAIVATTDASQHATPDWVTLAMEKGGTMAVLLAMFWIFKGYYDKAMARDAERSVEQSEILERVVTLATKQQEHATRSEQIIIENTNQTRATATLLERVASTLAKCHEKQP